MESNDDRAWGRLLGFALFCFSVPPGDEKVPNLTSNIRERVAKYMGDCEVPIFKPKKKLGERVTRGKGRMIDRAVSEKLGVGNIRGAIRIVSGAESVAPNTIETHKSLLDKHPPHTGPDLSTIVPSPTGKSTKVSLKDVSKAIKTFPSGSSGGWDSFLPQHLKDMTSDSLGETSRKTLAAISEVLDLIISGNVPHQIWHVFYGARLIALNKPVPGIRPIAIGLTLRRLASKLCNGAVLAKANHLMGSHQLGLGIPRGAEAAAHALRRYVADNSKSGKVVLKVDFRNAFNSISRSHILNLVHKHFPEVYSYVYSAYANPSTLFWESETISSAYGVQQGDPIGPFLFCLGIHGTVVDLKSEINTWYLDDGCLCGDPDVVLEDFKFLAQECSKFGLEINPSKCEIAVLSKCPDYVKETGAKFRSFASDIRLVDPTQLDLLGAALHPDGVENKLGKKLEIFQRMCANLDRVHAHDALYLLHHCFALPRLVYILRSSPCYRSPQLAEFEKALRTAMENILNCQLPNLKWSWVTLPVAQGGLGIRRPSDVAIPAFVSSVFASHHLSNRIYSTSAEDGTLADALLAWDGMHRGARPEELGSQKQWDQIQVAVKELEVTNALDTCPEDRARLLASKSTIGRAWLQCLPSQQLGLKLEDDDLSMSVGVRYGLEIMQQHHCVCGAVADSKGVHALSCKKVKGKFSRHAEVNDIIKRGMMAAGIPAVVEPPGLARRDGKRPDGLTLPCWSRGRPLVWDATIRHTIASSYVSRTSKRAGSAAEEGFKLKCGKYEELEDRFHVMPVSIETHGPIASESLRFLRQLGSRIEQKSGESRSTEFLLQRISIAVQRGNASCIRGTVSRGTHTPDYWWDVD